MKNLLRILIILVIGMTIENRYHVIDKISMVDVNISISDDYTTKASLRELLESMDLWQLKINDLYETGYTDTEEYHEACKNRDHFRRLIHLYYPNYNK